MEQGKCHSDFGSNEYTAHALNYLQAIHASFYHTLCAKACDVGFANQIETASMHLALNALKI